MAMRILICSYEFYPVIGGCEIAGMTPREAAGPTTAATA
jgi:hypothetical protein